MKEISEVVKEFQDKKEKEELIEYYKELLFKTKVLVNKDLCKIIEISNFDDYEKIEDFTPSIVMDNKFYHLYKDKNGKNLFINKANNYPSGFKSTYIETNHISDEEVEVILNLILEEEKVKPKGSSNFIDFINIAGAVVVLFSIFIFFLTIEEGFISIVITFAVIVVAIILFSLAYIMKQIDVIKDKLGEKEEE